MTAIYTKWLQKWIFVPYVIRRYQSGDVTQEFILIAVILWCAALANYGAVTYSLFFRPIATLLQAVLQANTEPLRNHLVETKNRAV